jgi:hypothetical protein
MDETRIQHLDSTRLHPLNAAVGYGRIRLQIAQ